RLFVFAGRRRHTRFKCDWSSDVCSSDLGAKVVALLESALFGRGFGGVVIIGSPTINTLFYLRAAADAAKSSPHGSRMYFTIDGRSEERRVGKGCRYRGARECM